MMPNHSSSENVPSIQLKQTLVGGSSQVDNSSFTGNSMSGINNDAASFNTIPSVTSQQALIADNAQANGNQFIGTAMGNGNNIHLYMSPFILLSDQTSKTANVNKMEDDGIPEKSSNYFLEEKHEDDKSVKGTAKNILKYAKKIKNIPDNTPLKDYYSPNTFNLTMDGRLKCHHLNLSKEDLRQSNFLDVSFISSSFKKAKLEKVSFENADLSNVELSWASGISGSQLAKAAKLHQVTINGKDRHNLRFFNDALEIQKLQIQLRECEEKINHLTRVSI